MSQVEVIWAVEGLCFWAEDECSFVLDDKEVDALSKSLGAEQIWYYSYPDTSSFLVISGSKVLINRSDGKTYQGEWDPRIVDKVDMAHDYYDYIRITSRGKSITVKMDDFRDALILSGLSTL